MGLLVSPVVVSGGLLNAVVPALSVDLIEIELKKVVGGKDDEEVPPEEEVEPSLGQLVGKVSGCKELLIPIVNSEVSVSRRGLADSIVPPDNLIEPVELIPFPSEDLEEGLPCVETGAPPDGRSKEHPVLGKNIPP